jgi:hypothetical protein
LEFLLSKQNRLGLIQLKPKVQIADCWFLDQCLTTKLHPSLVVGSTSPDTEEAAGDGKWDTKAALK